jgi:hypothetical protein
MVVRGARCGRIVKEIDLKRDRWDLPENHKPKRL